VWQTDGQTDASSSNNCCDWVKQQMDFHYDSFTNAACFIFLSTLSSVANVDFEQQQASRWDYRNCDSVTTWNAKANSPQSDIRLKICGESGALNFFLADFRRTKISCHKTWKYVQQCELRACRRKLKWEHSQTSDNPNPNPKCYNSPTWGEAPQNRFAPKFAWVLVR